MTKAEERLKKDIKFYNFDFSEKSPYIKLDENMTHCNYDSHDLFIKNYYDKEQKNKDIETVLKMLEEARKYIKEHAYLDETMPNCNALSQSNIKKLLDILGDVEE